MVGSSRDVYGEYLDPEVIRISDEEQSELDSWNREEARRQEEYQE